MTETQQYAEIRNYGEIVQAGLRSPEVFTMHAHCVFTEFGTFFLQDDYWLNRDGHIKTGTGKEFAEWHMQQRKGRTA